MEHAPDKKKCFVCPAQKLERHGCYVTQKSAAATSDQSYASRSTSTSTSGIPLIRNAPAGSTVFTAAFRGKLQPSYEKNANLRFRLLSNKRRLLPYGIILKGAPKIIWSYLLPLPKELARVGKQRRHPNNGDHSAAEPHEA